MIEAKVTSKGQITIPKKVRNLLNLQTGDKVIFVIAQDGKITLTTQTSGLDDIFGMFDYKSKGRLTNKDIHSAIAAHCRRKHK